MENSFRTQNSPRGVKALSDLPVKCRKFCFFFQTLSIRRIGDDKTILFRMMQFANRSLLEMDQFFHSGSSRIFSCTVHHCRIDIVSLNVCLDFQIDLLLCFFHRIVPVFLRDQMQPGF